MNTFYQTAYYTNLINQSLEQNTKEECPVLVHSSSDHQPVQHEATSFWLYGFVLFIGFVLGYMFSEITGK